MPDRPPVSAEDVPQSVVEAAATVRPSIRSYTGAAYSGSAEPLRDILTAALAEYERLGFRLVRDDEATVERAHYRVQACPQSDIVPRWSQHDTLREAQERANQFNGRDGWLHWHHVQIRDHNGNVVWDRDRDGFAALTAAQAKSEPANLATAPAGASGLGSEPSSVTVERMAKAMHKKAAQGGPWEAYIGLARAALTAAQEEDQ